jgi:hypothetical protein
VASFSLGLLGLLVTLLVSIALAYWSLTRRAAISLVQWSLLSDWLMNVYWLQTMIYFGARLLHRDLEEGEALLDEGRLINRSEYSRS